MAKPSASTVSVVVASSAPVSETEKNRRIAKLYIERGNIKIFVGRGMVVSKAVFRTGMVLFLVRSIRRILDLREANLWRVE